ncbi:MAG: hypothetical protein IT368_09110 [Candidatus Hydrogenedentes bacterium]|nr:hypothetical protein [Candidatus Hydrogenedentota bacterium]
MARDWREVDRLLQPYLLGTASNRDCARVDRWLAESPECRAALEAERQRLALLDLLPENPVPAGLATRTLAAVDQQAQLAPAERPGRPVFTALQGFIAVAVVIAAAAILIPAQQRWHQQVLREAVHNDLEILGAAMAAYASEAVSELYPPVSPDPGAWVPDIALLYPRYIDNPEDFVNSTLPNARELKREIHGVLERSEPDWERATRIFAEGFLYTGYAIEDAEAGERWKAAWREGGREQRRSDLKTGDETFYRLRPGVYRFLITDVNDPRASSSGYCNAIIAARCDEGLIGLCESGATRLLTIDYFFDPEDLD